VVVQVDKAGADDQAGAVDGLERGAGIECSDGDDPASLEGDITSDSGIAATIDNRGILQQNVGIQRRLSQC
jgi:hypothetical protein